MEKGVKSVVTFSTSRYSNCVCVVGFCIVSALVSFHFFGNKSVAKLADLKKHLTMFKKFSSQGDIVSQVPVKSSVQRSIRSQIVEQFPCIESFIDDILPKKEKWILIKCHGHMNLLSINYEPPLFFNVRTGPYFPSLRLLHAYPFLLPRLQVDKGAIRHILKGADIMCPGLTSAGARMEESLPSNRMVGIFAEGKEHALAIGITKLSTEEIRNLNKGVAVENIHYLNDGLWKLCLGEQQS